MTISKTTAVIGLSAQAARTREGVTGNPVVGKANTTISLPNATIAYQSQMLIVSGTGTLNLETGDLTAGAAFVAGTAQVETATADGTIVQDGTIKVTVTADAPWSPKILTGVSATVGELPVGAGAWAEKVRVALAADVDVSAMFTAGGTGADITLTRKQIGSLSHGGTTYPIYAADDATLNIALENGTCDGITEDLTSADTTAGVATSGALLFNDDVDFEGVAIPTATEVHALLIENDGGEVDYVLGASESGLMLSGDKRLLLNSGSHFVDALVFTAATPTKVAVTVMSKE